MKRFAFGLDRVLDFRRQEEEQEIGRLHALYVRRLQLEEHARSLAEQSVQVRASCAAQTVLSAPDLRYAQAYSDSLTRARLEALAEAKRVEEQRRQQIFAVLEARRRVELLKLLRVKRLARHRREAVRQEELLTNELHLSKLQRQQKNS